MSNRRITWFWRAYTGFLMLVLAAVSGVGGPLEQRLEPIRSHSTITNVVRSEYPHQICWDWNSLKERDAVSNDMDVFLETPTDQFVTSVYEKGTLMPWGRSRAVGIGWHVQPYCVQLPSTVTASDAVTVRQRIYYPGFLGAWRVPVDLPNVVDDPAHRGT